MTATSGQCDDALHGALGPSPRALANKSIQSGVLTDRQTGGLCQGPGSMTALPHGYTGPGSRKWVEMRETPPSEAAGDAPS